MTREAHPSLYLLSQNMPHRIASLEDGVFRSSAETAATPEPIEVDFECLRGAGLVLCNAVDVDSVSTMLGRLGLSEIEVQADPSLDPGRAFIVAKDHLPPPLGTCMACERRAPLVDGECPNCRH